MKDWAALLFFMALFAIYLGAIYVLERMYRQYEIIHGALL